MSNRYLQKKVALIPDDSMLVWENSIELEYYLLESEENDLDEMVCSKVYGVEIVKRTNRAEVEAEIVKNLSNSLENAKNLLCKLANNTVTPVGLPFVLDDIIGV